MPRADEIPILLDPSFFQISTLVRADSIYRIATSARFNDDALPTRFKVEKASAEVIEVLGFHYEETLN